MPELPPRNLLVFGATGGTGTAIVRDAVTRGYGVTAFVRDSRKAEQHFDGLLPRITLAEGDAANPADVARAVGDDVHAVISSLGIFHPLPGRFGLSEATGNILAAMPAAGTQRFLCVSSVGVGDSRNQGDLVTRIIQKTTLRFTLADKEKQEQMIRNSALDWTLIRPSRLLNEGGPAEVAIWTGPQPEMPLVWAINRADVATLTLDCIETPATIGNAINITGRATTGS